MGEGQVVTLLIACGVGGFLGAMGKFEGAHVVAAFSVLGAIAAWSNFAPFGWLEIVAPVAFAYGAAAVAQSVENSRNR